MTDTGTEDQIPPGGDLLADFRWEPWSPAEVAGRLAGVRARWAIAAGWALDLFRGSVSREHEDLEVAVPAADFGAIRDAFPGFEFEVVGAGRKWRLSDRRAFDFMHQTWLRDPETGLYRLDVFREPHDGDTWICRRDRSIRRPYSEVVRRTDNGLPYVAPEIVLLFKATWSRPKDEADLDLTLPRLDLSSRRWLRRALERVHPGHGWLARISE